MGKEGKFLRDSCTRTKWDLQYVNLIKRQYQQVCWYCFFLYLSNSIKLDFNCELRCINHVRTNLYSHRPNRLVGTLGYLTLIYPLPPACHGMVKTSPYLWIGFASDRRISRDSLENASIDDYKYRVLWDSFCTFSTLLYDLEFNLFVSGGRQMREIGRAHV